MIDLVDWLEKHPGFNGPLRIGGRNFYISPMDKFHVTEGNVQWAYNPNVKEWMDVVRWEYNRPSNTRTPIWGTQVMPPIEDAPIASIHPWFKPITSEGVQDTMTEEELIQPWRLMSWGYGEYIEALWIANNEFLVKASFRAHGHGESYLDICRVRGEGAGEWVNLMDDMPVDFGRQCDKVVRDRLFPGLSPIASDFLSKILASLKIEVDLKTNDAALVVMDAMLGKALEGLSIDANALSIESTIWDNEGSEQETRIVHVAMFDVVMDMMREICYGDNQEVFTAGMLNALKFMDNDQLKLLASGIVKAQADIEAAMKRRTPTGE